MDLQLACVLVVGQLAADVTARATVRILTTLSLYSSFITNKLRVI